MRAPARILVIGLSNVGDAVLMSPVIQRLWSRYPGARLTLIVGERARMVYSGDPRVRTLWGMEDFSGAWGKVRLVAAMWRANPDLLVDLRQTILPLFWRPWRVARYLWPVPKSVVHMRDRHVWKLIVQESGLTAALWHRQQFNAQCGMPNAESHSGQAPEDLTQPIPHSPSRIPNSARDTQSPMWIAPEEEAAIDRLTTRWGLDPAKPLVVMCPGARSHIKRWDVDRFAKLADRLIEERGVEVLFTGEPDETPVIHEAMQAMRRRAHSAAGSTTLQQLGALMQRARLVITNDSATLHVASAVGAPVLALFGPTDARKYGPTGPRDRVIRRRLFCSPCEQALCRYSHECMRFIPVDEVYQAASEMLIGREARDEGRA